MTRLSAARVPAHDRELDVRGLTCPLPALRARLILSKMASGEILRIVATDRGAPRDIATFAKATGNPLIKQSATRAEFIFYLRKG